MEISRRKLIIAGAMTPMIMNAIPAVAEPVVEKVVKKDFLMPDHMRLSDDRSDHGFANYDLNVWTYVYDWMQRWRLDENGKLKSISIAHRLKHKDIYDQWLIDTGPYDIPPHIQFGGAIVAGKGDPLFKKKWEDHTKMLLRTGALA